MTAFEFATAGRIIFGAGVFQQAGALAAEAGRRALLASGLNAERSQALGDLLQAAGVTAVVWPVSGEPTVAAVQAGVELARREGCDLVIGFGGGSAIDAGKAAAALLTNPGDPLDYLEVIGRGRALANPPLPYIAIPTTAGTGAEVTRNAVLGAPEQRLKVSLRSPLMLPRLALVDPELTYSLPPEVTASTGMDALTQLLEPFVCNRANPLTDAICREGLPRLARSLRRAFEHGSDAAARADLSLGALFGGLALANARLGAVHGFAAPLGGMFPDAPHGAVCARLLPIVVSANLQALGQRDPGSPALARYAEAARLLTGSPQATAADGAAWLAELAAALRIPPLSAYGVTPQDFPDLVEKAAKASSMQGNPVRLSGEELEAILAQAL